MIKAVRALMAALLFAATAAPAFSSEAHRWIVDPTASRIGFEATQMNAPFEGRFSDFTADIAFDADNLDGSRVRVEIAVASIDTGNAERDAAALSADWFNAAKYPTAVFETTAIEALADGRFAASGRLTLRETTREIVLPFTLAVAEGAELLVARVTGEIDIDRTDYGVGQGQWSTGGAVGRRVLINIALTATREK